MKPILFYGVPSGCSFGSIVALEWLGAPYQLCRIAMPEVVSGDAYRRINPVGETPTLRTAAGDLLSQSLAILNHLAAGEPRDRRELDHTTEVLAFLNTSFFGAFSPLWFALEHPSGDGSALRRYGQTKVRAAHAKLEAMLGDQPWLAGDRRSVADAYFLGIARWTTYHGDVLDRRAYPALQRLYDKLEADPAVIFAHAIEAEQPATSAGGFAGHVALDDVLASLAAPRAAQPSSDGSRSM